jgi:hypothetical protein
MHSVTSRTHRMQKHKFDVTCPSALFVETAPVPLEHEKYCVDVSWPGPTRKHYMTHRSHWMPKHKFDITCPDAILVESILVPLEHEK